MEGDNRREAFDKGFAEGYDVAEKENAAIIEKVENTIVAKACDAFCRQRCSKDPKACAHMARNGGCPMIISFRKNIL